MGAQGAGSTWHLARVLQRGPRKLTRHPHARSGSSHKSKDALDQVAAEHLDPRAWLKGVWPGQRGLGTPGRGEGKGYKDKGSHA